MPTLQFPHLPSSTEYLTYADVALGTNNATDSLLDTKISDPEKHHLALLSNEYRMALAKNNPAEARQKGKTLQQYQWSLSQKYAVLLENISRYDVDVTPRGGFGNIPLMFPNLTHLIGGRFAEAASRMGASAVFSQDMSDKTYLQKLAYVKSRHVLYDTPATVHLDTPLYEIKKQFLRYEPVYKRGEEHKGFTFYAVVVDSAGVFQGIISSKDISEEDSGNDVAENIMKTQNIITAKDGISDIEAYKHMKHHHIDYLPILTEEGKVRGVLTLNMLARRFVGLSPHINMQGELATIGAISAMSQQTLARAKLLIDAGIDGLVLDTAHFDNGIIGYRNIDAVRNYIEQAGKKVFLIAGNVIDPSAVQNIITAGADMAKVGIGPGGMCTTRKETGVGFPQFSTVSYAVEAAEKVGGFVLADGGIRGISGNIAKALGVGASMVMTSFNTSASFQGHFPLLVDPDKGLFRERSGMASSKMANARKQTSLHTSRKSIGRSVLGDAAEGITRRSFQKDGFPTVGDSVLKAIEGVRSAMTYSGSKNLQEFFQNARFIRQTPAGLSESIR